jgi:thiamine biosynthesis lipoprotein
MLLSMIPRIGGLRYRARFALLPPLVLVLLTAGCDRGDGIAAVTLRGATMGTTYSVVLSSPPARLDPAALQQRIDALLEEVNGLMSTYRPDSELSRFNALASTDWMPVSPELVRVVSAADAISRASGGRFDITVGPLVNLWGFGPQVDADRLPSQAEIDTARSRIGYRKLERRDDPPALRKRDPGLYVDLSAIAKGYGVDRVAELLEAEGVENYLVEIGGELRGRGRSGRGDPWRIAIERPESAGRSVFRVVELHATGMATSGDYRNFFEIDGKRYSHSIDPVTGRPVAHALASVTVLADSTMLADGWATALLVSGPERGMALAEAEGLAALLIVRDGDGYRAIATAAFEASAAQRHEGGGS